MRTPPVGEPWVAAALAKAARWASARGAPEGAVAYLERGLAERPGPVERRELLLELGKAESQIHSPRAAIHLREALALATEPEEIAGIALWLGQALFHKGSLDQAFDVLSAVIDQADGGGGDVMLEVEAYQLSIATAAGTLVETAARAASLGTRTPASSRAAGAVAYAGVPGRLRWRAPRAGARARRAGPDRHRGRRLSSRALTSRTGRRRRITLIVIDELDRAIALQTQLLTAAARMGQAADVRDLLGSTRIRPLSSR